MEKNFCQSCAMPLDKAEMNIQKYTETPVTQLNETTQRRLIHTENLMTVIVDFSGGPAEQPDPFHSHLHDQTCYIAAGEVLFFIGENSPVHVKAGDLIAIPGGIPHAIQLLTPTARLIDSFTPVREDFL
ncbi:MAG: cupin domain-containing protein [Tannerellaceae bacterium]|nr:cupin domain-containing protein [Tannerellaceae bacterium]